MLLSLATVISTAVSTYWSLRANTATVDTITSTLNLLSPAITYDLTEGFARSLAACPGATLPPFGYSVIVNRPAVAQLIGTWAPITAEHPEGDWGDQTGSTGGLRRLSAYPVAPARYTRMVVDVQVPFLPPGEYVRAVVAEFEGSQLELYSQTVTVLDC